MNIRPRFGAVYTFGDFEEKALAKQKELKEKGIEAAVGYGAVQSPTLIMGYTVYTNEETRDLDDFRERGGREFIG